MTLFLELLIILALIVANGFFAGAEIAILTSRRNRLEEEAAAGSRAAAIAAALANDPNRFLSTVQVGITLVATLASVFGGATLVYYLSESLGQTGLPWLVAHRDSVAFGTVVLGISFVSLVIGELVPKRMALLNAERIARRVAYPMKFLAWVASPLVWIMATTTEGILWLLRSRGESEARVSVEDIEHLIRAGMREGVLDPAEQMMAQRALRLGDRTVREIMRQRIEVDALDVDTPPEEVIGAVAMAGFSRLPVHEGDLDHIIGFIYTKDLLLRQHMGWPIDIRKLVRPALLVPETLPIDRLLERFRQQRTQMALVLDEFGGTEGLVTMEDVLEELVGEIHDEHRQQRPQQIVQRDDGSWLVDAALGVHEVLDYIGMGCYRHRLSADFTTVGGLVLSLLGRIPKVGDCAVFHGMTLEVVAMEGHRLSQLRIAGQDPGKAQA